MKLIKILFVTVISFNLSHAQKLNGAWKKLNKKTEDVMTIKLYSDHYFTSSTYVVNSGEFVSASAGTYSRSPSDYVENYEIDSDHRAVTGSFLNFDYTIENDTLRLQDKNSRNSEVWVRIDSAEKENITCWKIHQAYREGEWKTIEDKPRKSLKMLTDNYYQVIGLNSQTGEFFGSSGGKWTYENGKHNEIVHFFSKNPDMVGQTLSFDKKINDGIWHHDGNSSEGDYIQERWKKFK
ncbi:MAG: hypothetical protein KGY51_07845 [Psychroflexus sp.]|nr:hypothetical protein [Psychroflexus sp.]